MFLLPVTVAISLLIWLKSFRASSEQEGGLQEPLTGHLIKLTGANILKYITEKILTAVVTAW